MYEVQTETAIKNRMLAKVSAEVDTAEGSFTYDAIAPAALELANAYAELDSVLKRVFAQTAVGNYLDNRAEEFGLTRNLGTGATGTVRFTGADGVVVPVNTVIQTAGGLQYKTTAAATVVGNTVSVAVEAAEIGKIYNVPASAVSRLATSILGVSAVTNPEPMAGGMDQETDAALLERLLSKVRNPSVSGNANDYRNWALSVNGIGDAKVVPLWNDNGTVKVILVDGDKQPASGELVARTADYIATVKPIGAEVTVVPAQKLWIRISVAITKDPAYTMEQVISNIKNTIEVYLKSIAFGSGYVSYARIGNAILDSEGVVDYDPGLTVNEGTENIPVGFEQIPVLGTVTVT